MSNNMLRDKLVYYVKYISLKIAYATRDNIW